MNTKKLDIEQYEKEILEDLDKDEFVPVENLDEQMQLAKQAASNFTK